MRPTPYSNELYHHGIKGQRWGVRRYRNEDGSLTEAGKKREAKRAAKLEKQTPGLEKWRAKEQQRLENFYGKREAKYQKKETKLRQKMADAEADGNLSTSKRRRLEDKITDAKFQQYFNSGQKIAESSKLNSMTMKELRDDRSAVRLRRAGNTAANVALTALFAVHPIGGPMVVANAIATRNKPSQKARLRSGEYDDIVFDAMRKSGKREYQEDRGMTIRTYHL